MLTKYPRILLEAADGNSGGGTAPDPRDAEIAALRARSAAFEKAEADRKAAEDEKVRAKLAKDEDAAKRALADKDRELDELRAKTKLFEERETARFDALHGELPDDAKERIAKYKDKINVDVYRQMVQDEHDAMIKTRDIAPTIRSSGGGMGVDRGTISERAREILENIPGDHERAIKLISKQRIKDEKTGVITEVLGVPMKKFLDNLQTLKGKNLNRADAERRKIIAQGG